MNAIANDNMALSGIKVLDLTRALAGPVCSSLLGDMGAEVIRIENPADGKEKPVMDAAVRLLHRNKKSITLNTRTEKGKDILRKLIQRADVLIENFKPGIMKTMGFDYPEVKKINPRIVMVSISGYGQTGPYSGRAGLDGVGQAMGGIMSTTGPEGSPPTFAGAAIADYGSGIFGAFGAVLALFKRNSTGMGQHVETTLMDSVAYMMGLSIARYGIGQENKRDAINQLPGSGTFLTKDEHYIVIMGSLPQHYPLFANLIGRDDLATAPGYRTRLERDEHVDEIRTAFQQWIQTQTISEVESAMERMGIPFGKVQTIEELLKDPHLMFRNRISEVNVDGDKVPMMAPYPILSDTPGTIRTPCPKPGEHNEDIYGSILGFSKDEVEALKTEGVI
ncbi:MAG: CoA transferase [Desulfobacteraceae bacterium]|nr:CoA transferase [Desulfobacteraceae bacterium]